MNTDTGTIYSAQQMAEFREAFGHKPLPKNFKEMQIAPTPLQLANGKVGRNDPCPCGSGLKFKRCCCTSKGRR